jgi:hypothetical protein
MEPYHKHLFNCEHDASVKRVCLACRWEEWQAAAKKPTSVIGKTFEQLITQDDAKFLHELLIAV